MLPRRFAASAGRKLETKEYTHIIIGAGIVFTSQIMFTLG